MFINVNCSRVIVARVPISYVILCFANYAVKDHTWHFYTYSTSCMNTLKRKGPKCQIWRNWVFGEFWKHFFNVGSPTMWDSLELLTWCLLSKSINSVRWISPEPSVYRIQNKWFIIKANLEPREIGKLSTQFKCSGIWVLSLYSITKSVPHPWNKDEFWKKESCFYLS